MDLNISFLNQFKNLNPRKIYNWPTVPKMAVMVGLLISTISLGYLLTIKGNIEELTTSIEKENTLKKEFIEKKKQSVNLELYKEQLIEIDKLFGVLLKQLPNKTDIGPLLVDINKAALSRGLDMKLFKPANETPQDFYAEFPIEIELEGKYEDVGNFASDIANLPRIVQFLDLKITKPIKNDRLPTQETKIQLVAKIKTYRYLDNDEIAAAKKKKDEENKKKKKTTSKKKEDTKAAKH